MADSEDSEVLEDSEAVEAAIPLRLQGSNFPEKFELRGEILMPWNVFEQLNKEREQQGEQLFFFF